MSSTVLIGQRWSRPLNVNLNAIWLNSDTIGASKYLCPVIYQRPADCTTLQLLTISSDTTDVTTTAPDSFIFHLYLTTDKKMWCNLTPWSYNAVVTICFWPPSTEWEQLARHAADAWSKQAEADDTVNHGFTASVLWGLKAESAGSVGLPFFFLFYHTEASFHTISALCWAVPSRSTTVLIQ